MPPASLRAAGCRQSSGRCTAGRIEALDPQVNAFLLPTPDKAREQARAAEREIMAGRYRGPLHGIPFGLKDI
jgi:Asp-tRNA(Asn)/Glu-tRNA(Gln) amidotransferase A subunit family amidase